MQCCLTCTNPDTLLFTVDLERGGMGRLCLRIGPGTGLILSTGCSVFILRPNHITWLWYLIQHKVLPVGTSIS